LVGCHGGILVDRKIRDRGLRPTNRAPEPMFMAVFLGTAAACLALAVSSFFRWSKPGAAYA
jgi:hypothetical protein